MFKAYHTVSQSICHRLSALVLASQLYPWHCLNNIGFFFFVKLNLLIVPFL